MSSEQIQLIVLGRFPPPNDGQAIATNRFVENLGDSFVITSINTSVDASASVLGKIRSYFQSGSELRAALKRMPSAIIVWHSISPELAGHLRDLMTIFPALKNRRVIAVVHWGKFASVFTKAATAMSARLAVASLDKVVFTDASLSNACEKWLSSGQRCVIPNSIDQLAQASPDEVALAQSQRPHAPFRVLFLSNMIKEKGYLDVLGAVCLLNEQGVKVSATFAGAWQTDEDREMFLEQVRQGNATEFITHLGAISDRTRIKKLYLEADVFVLPSYLKEAQPLTIAEALSAGTPAIVANDGGMPAMIDYGKAGRVVSAQNVQGIRDAILELSNAATWEECSQHARQIFEDRFASVGVRQQWTDLIRRVAEEDHRLP